MFEDTIDPLVEADVLGEGHFRTLWRLVLRARIIRRAEVGLEERNAGAVRDVHRASRAFALGPSRGRKADDADRPGLGEQFGHFRDSPHVLFALRTRNSEIRTEAWTNVFAIKHEHLNMPLEELPLERLGERGFP